MSPRTLLISATLLSGALLGLAQLLMPPLAAHLQPQIELALNQALGQEVRVQRVTGSWRNWGPQLQLHQLSLRDPAGAKLTFDQVQIDIAPLDSLLQGRLVVESAALVRAELSLIEQADGRWRLLGVEQQGGATPASPGLALEQVPAGLGLIDSRLLLSSQRPASFLSGKPLELGGVNLRLRHQSEGFSLQARLQLAGGSANALQFGAEIQGPSNRPELWSGALYLQADALSLADLLRQRVPPDWTQLQGELNLRLWAQLEQGRLGGLEGSLGLADLRLQRQLRNRLSGYDLEQLQGSFRWQRQAEGWLLQLADVQLERNDNQWPKSAISLQQSAVGLEAAVDFLRLEDILALVMLLPDNRAELLLTGLQRVQPFGDLRQLRFRQDQGRWQLQGSAAGIRTQAWRGFPSIDSLSGEFRADQNGGIAELDNKDLHLGFADGLFPHPMRFPRLQGAVHWQRHPQGWQIGSQNLQISTPDFKTATQFSLSIPDRGHPHLQLGTALEQGDVAYVGNYLPAGIMNPKVVSWLQRALVSGRISQASARFEGALEDFPFDKGEAGGFLARVETEDVTLDYQPGWPRLERAAVALEFRNNSFSAQLKSADISASRVKQASASIQSLYPVSALMITGLIEGPLSDDLRVLSDTPLASKLGPIAEGVVGSGDARLGIRLQVPLSEDDPAELRVQGDLEFLGNRLQLERFDLDLEQVQGRLEFDDQGVQAKQIQARAQGSDLSISIASEGHNRTLIHASGRFDIQTLSQRRLGMELPLSQGQSLWNLQLEIPHQSAGAEAGVEISLSSDLQGVAVDLPPPLGKAAKTNKPVRISLSPAQQPLPVHLRWGDELDARLLLNRGDNQTLLERGNIRLGGAPAEAPEQAGMWISGKLSHFQLDPWLPLLGADQSQKQNENQHSLPLPHLDVELGHLQLLGIELDDLRLNGGPEGTSYAARIDSPMLKGRLQLPKALNNQPIVLDLERLAFNLRGDDSPRQVRKPSKQDPRQLPALQLRSKALLLNGHDLGRFDLQTLKGPQGLDISQFQISSDWLKLDLKGQWQQIKDQPRCNSMLKLETKDMGRL
ncbi:MAG: TIGR02099 family protein, partial [Gammaproteobacteria bacterium]|nr:TIGR02099 family protein [Gammaproteobacteria bacterium]